MTPSLLESYPIVNEPRTAPFPLIHTLWHGRRWLLSGIFVGLMLSLLLAFWLPVRYASTIELLPELKANQAINLQPFRELAELMGHEFDAKGQVEAVRPDLYPDILKSTPFALSVLHQRVRLRSKRQLPLYQLLAETAWPFSVDSLTQLPQPTDEPIRLTKPQRELIEDLKSLIKADLNPKTGILLITAHMPEPDVAAQVVQFSANYLQTFVREYRTDKARKNEKFAQKQMEDARRIADKLEQNMLANQDGTRFLSLPSASLLNRRLSSQYAAANALYQELEREHAKAKIQVQDVTPVFKVLEPAQVPDRRSSPRRFWIVLAGVVSGFMVVALVLWARGIWR